MVISFLVIRQWLAWKVINGSKVQLCLDAWVGGEKYFILSYNIYLALNMRGLLKLSDASTRGNVRQGTQECHMTPFFWVS